jgi:hypothetical protein
MNSGFLISLPQLEGDMGRFNVEERNCGFHGFELVYGNRKKEKSSIDMRGVAYVVIRKRVMYFYDFQNVERAVVYHGEVSLREILERYPDNFLQLSRYCIVAVKILRERDNFLPMIKRVTINRQSPKTELRILLGEKVVSFEISRRTFVQNKLLLQKMVTRLQQKDKNC